VQKKAIADGVAVLASAKQKPLCSESTSHVTVSKPTTVALELIKVWFLFSAIIRLLIACTTVSMCERDTTLTQFI